MRRKSVIPFLMEETKYNGPEMNIRKMIVLLLTAALILFLFFTKTKCEGPLPEIEPMNPKPEEYLYISPFDSIFRLYADSVCDWKMLAAIAYVESKFDTTARSSQGAMGLMQIMPSTYRHMLARLGEHDTTAQNTVLDVRVAVRYLDEMDKMFGFINKEERINYILGSYNGGTSHIFDAMRLARKNGINRYRWSNIEPILESLTDSLVYSDSVCKFGYFDATETLQYVRRVKKKYREYNTLDLMFRASEKLAENNNEIYNNN